MRRPLGMVLSLLAAGAAAVEPAAACGDKFIVLGRTVRAQRARGAVHRASVVIMLDPASELPAAIKASGLLRELQLSGHAVRHARSAAEAQALAETGTVDVLVASLADVDRMAAGLEGRPAARPLMVPVLLDPTPEELESARARYGCALRSPGGRHYLGVIEDALAAKRRARR
jgi:hypothetical protein